jgi:predicted acylesterase/phospholipase RssA
MLRALVERGILPDLVVGSSVGAINGAALAAEPTLGTVRRLDAAWGRLGHERVFDSSLRVARTLVRERSHLQSDAPVRRLIDDLLPPSHLRATGDPAPVRGRLYRAGRRALLQRRHRATSAKR